MCTNLDSVVQIIGRLERVIGDLKLEREAPEISNVINGLRKSYTPIGSLGSFMPLKKIHKTN